MFQRTLSSVVAFFKESRGELKKVSWLTRREVIQYTVAVFVLSLVLAAYLGTIDYFLGQGLRLIIPH